MPEASDSAPQPQNPPAAAAADAVAKPAKEPILRCFEEPGGCQKAALNAKDATEKGWYFDVNHRWFCDHHGPVQRDIDQFNRTEAVKQQRR